MKHQYLLPLLFLAVIFLGSCKKSKQSSSTPANRDNILNANAHIVDTSALANVTATSLTLHKANLTFSPSVGDIIFSAPSANDSFGLLVKITAITANGNDLNCFTQQSNLNDAFRQLFIDYTYSDTFSANAHFRTTGSTGSKFNYFFNQTTFAGGFVLNGNLELNIPSTEIRYVKKDGSSLPDTVLILANLNTNGSNLVVSSSGAAQATEITLKEFNLPRIKLIVPVFGIPIPIYFTQKISLKVLPASISGKMKFNINPQIAATLGASYENGDWENLSTYSTGASVLPFQVSDFDASMNATATFFNPVYEIAPYGLEDLNAFFEIPNNFDLTIQTRSPNYSLKYKLNVTGGISAKFWDGTDLSHSFTGTLYEPTILEGNFTYHIGDTAFGGIIFYLDTSNRHGLVCALVDQEVDSPGFFLDLFAQSPYMDDSSIGSGASNTTLLNSLTGHSFMSQYGGMPIFGYRTANPATLCHDYSSDGFNDWFLPSKIELNKLYINKSYIRNLASAYWCSTFSNDGPAYDQGGNIHYGVFLNGQNFTNGLWLSPTIGYYVWGKAPTDWPYSFTEVDQSTGQVSEVAGACVRAVRSF